MFFAARIKKVCWGAGGKWDLQGSLWFLKAKQGVVVFGWLALPPSTGPESEAGVSGTGSWMFVGFQSKPRCPIFCVLLVVKHGEGGPARARLTCAGALVPRGEAQTPHPSSPVWAQNIFTITRETPSRRYWWEGGLHLRGNPLGGVGGWLI